MVGVVGSNPIVPTKQNPHCWRVRRRAIRKGRPFFRLGMRWEGVQLSGLLIRPGVLILNDLFALAFLVTARPCPIDMTPWRLVCSFGKGPEPRAWCSIRMEEGAVTGDYAIPPLPRARSRLPGSGEGEALGVLLSCCHRPGERNKRHPAPH